MRRLPSNIVHQRVFVQEAVAVYEESKWTIYAWWLVLGVAGGTFGSLALSPQVASPWWLLPSYLLAVFIFKRAAMKLARRLFPGDLWWQVTSIFLVAFLLAGFVAAVSRLTSWKIIALPLIVAFCFYIGFLHTAFRVVFVRDQIGWVWSAAPLAAVAALTGWVLLYNETLTLSTARSAAAVGATVGFLYAFLTTLLLALMWDVGVALSTIGTAYVDKDNEFEEGLRLHDAAIAANPNEPKLYTARAGLYLKRGDLNGAKSDTERAFALDPKSKTARLMRAIIMSEDGNVDAAIAELDQVVDCKLDFQIGYLYRARAYTKKGDCDRALADLEKSMGLTEDPAMTIVSRAETYHRMGDYDSAIADCDQIFLLNTMTPKARKMAYIVRAKANAAKGEYKLAVIDLMASLNGTTDPKLLHETALELEANPFSNNTASICLCNRGTTN